MKSSMMSLLAFLLRFSPIPLPTADNETLFLFSSHKRACHHDGDFSFEATIKMPLRRFSPESSFGAFYFDAMRWLLLVAVMSFFY